ncbi:MAG: hypothetical protein LBU36_00400 [Clostridiales bacterium]|nr:hypothetical protein [Clostridiales bacterium]
MTEMRMEAVQYIQSLSDGKLTSAVDYLHYLYERNVPIDEFEGERRNPHAEAWREFLEDIGYMPDFGQHVGVLENADTFYITAHGGIKG